jgi:uncharacterized protein DUF6644
VTLLQSCEWLEHTWVSTTIRHSQWGFALIEMVHLVALALLGGALLVTGLRIFGVILRDQRPAVITRDLSCLILVSLLGLILSGTLLFSEGPLRYYANAAFRMKLVLLGLALVSTATTRLIAKRYSSAQAIPAPVRTMTALSLMLWLGVGIAGRVIGIL